MFKDQLCLTVIQSRAFLVAVTSECRVNRIICKPVAWLSAGILANSADQDQKPQNAASDQGLHYKLKLQEVKG